MDDAYFSRRMRRGMRRDRYDVDFAGEPWRLGVHDFAEGYGRYSGGDPYGYDVTEGEAEYRPPRSAEARRSTRRPPYERRRRPRGAPWARRALRRLGRDEGEVAWAPEQERARAGRERPVSPREGRERPPRRGRRWYEPRNPW